MPYSLKIDRELRLVIGTLRGAVSEDDVVGYFNDPLWFKNDVIGYSELIDVTHVQALTFQLAKRLPLLADLSAQRDLPGILAGHLVMVATDDHLFGLARMYQTLRELHPRTQRKVGVFRSRAQGLAWLAAVRSVAENDSSLTASE
jgi:hypothetical protein